jgi:hypothetical protein
MHNPYRVVSAVSSLSIACGTAETYIISGDSMLALPLRCRKLTQTAEASENNTYKFYAIELHILLLELSSDENLHTATEPHEVFDVL